MRALATVSICLLLALAGCGASSSRRPANAPSTRSPSRSSSRSSTALDSSEGGCATALAKSGVRVTIYGEGEAACKAWEQSASATSVGLWQPVALSSDRSEAQVVCSTVKGSTLIEVRASGNLGAADKICAALTRSRDGEASVRAGLRAEQKTEAERPGHAAAARRFSDKAASLRDEQRHEEALASDDEARAERLVSKADQVEAEESGEGGNKEAQAQRIRAGAQRFRGQAQLYQTHAARLMREAEHEEAAAKREQLAATPPPATWLPR
jgi:hypothetical protein